MAKQAAKAEKGCVESSSENVIEHMAVKSSETLPFFQVVMAPQV